MCVFSVFFLYWLEMKQCVTISMHISLIFPCSEERQYAEIIRPVEVGGIGMDGRPRQVVAVPGFSRTLVEVAQQFIRHILPV